MTTKTIRTVLPIAPNVYDQNFANQLARNLDRVIDDQRNPVLNIQNVPSDGVANILEVGDLFQENGFVRIDKMTNLVALSVRRAPLEQ